MAPFRGHQVNIVMDAISARPPLWDFHHSNRTRSRATGTGIRKHPLQPIHARPTRPLRPSLPFKCSCRRVVWIDHASAAGGGWRWSFLGGSKIYRSAIGSQSSRVRSAVERCTGCRTFVNRGSRRCVRYRLEEIQVVLWAQPFRVWSCFRHTQSRRQGLSIVSE
jgi:hypothetical protein